MKYIVFFFMAPLILLGACRSVPRNAPDFETDFRTYAQEKTIFLFPDKAENSPSMKISLNLFEFAGNDGLQECIYRVLYENAPPSAYGDSLIVSWEKSYARAAGIWEESYGESFNWEYIETIEAADLGRVVQVKRTRYEFTGGAHGSQTEEFYLFDKTGKDGATPNQVLLSDIIAQDVHADLLQLIESRLRMDEGLSPEASLSEHGFLVDVIEMPSEFSITQREGASSAPPGVVFHWNPYEIAPYARGHVKTVVPYEAIQRFLTGYGRELLR